MVQYLPMVKQVVARPLLWRVMTSSAARAKTISTRNMQPKLLIKVKISALRNAASSNYTNN